MSSAALTIIAERINSSRRLIAQAIREEDEALIQREARLQREAGADYIDVNAGTFLDEEARYLPWLVRTVQACVDAPLSLDSPNPGALKAALREHHGRPIINSVTLEKERMDAIVPLALEHSCRLIALMVDSRQVPADADSKLDVAVRLVDALTRAGIRAEDIILDPVIQPVCAAGNSGAETLDAISRIRRDMPDVHILCGLRNISFDLPRRPLLDRAFLAMAMAAGVDTAIIDPCDSDIMATIAAAEALLGRDEFCMRYITAHREGRLGPQRP